jgi:epoxyqueuosine reductase
MSKESIRQQALAVGFDACHFTLANPPASFAHYQAWLADGFQADMAYLDRQASKRGDPQLILAGAKSIITLASSYTPPPDKPHSQTPNHGVIARYARYRDYHLVLNQKLEQLCGLIIQTLGPAIRCLAYVDTGPLLERDLAQRAGLGFIGKHTNLISRTLGNWIFLSEIITTAALEPDPPESNRCGNCRRCLDACPTGALVAPFRLDSRRCLAYWTIENKGPIPEPFRAALGGRVFGCDDCLEVCPWNRFARETHALNACARADLAAPDLRKLLQLDDAGFRREFDDTPLQRLKRERLLRNACVAAGNVGDAELIPVLAKVQQRESPMVAEHAAWAIDQIQSRIAKKEPAKNNSSG